MPLFMIASATETKKSCCGGKKQQEAPAWRVALGNLAAGATSGCAVEAGAWHPLWHQHGRMLMSPRRTHATAPHQTAA